MKQFFKERGYSIFIVAAILGLLAVTFVTYIVTHSLSSVFLFIIAFCFVYMLFTKIIEIKGQKKKLMLEQRRGEIQNKKEEIEQQKYEIEDQMYTVGDLYPQIFDVIRDIDNKISSGMTFSSMSLSKWNDVYKKEIISVLSCNCDNYSIPEDQQSEIMKILVKLQTDLISKSKLDSQINTSVSIEALKNMVKYDIGSSDFH